MLCSVWEKKTWPRLSGWQLMGGWKKHGKGIYYYLANNEFKGDIFIGEYKDNKRNGQGKQLLVTGHSLGAALATLYTDRISDPKSVCYTFMDTVQPSRMTQFM